MTLGRTTSGAIKIKTDGGLRAVNCACCGCDVCSAIVMPASISIILDAITSPSQCSLLGIKPNNFFVSDDYLIMGWTGDMDDPSRYFFGSSVYYKESKCFSMNFRYWSNMPFSNQTEEYVASGLCADQGENLFITDFLINNKTFPSYYFVDRYLIAPTVKPVFVFT
jgi:hypothetical protein